MKNPLRNLQIGLTGDFGAPRSHENMRRWIENNGGTFTDTVDKHTTHLISSWEAYKSKAPAVRKAVKLGGSLRIVSFDWLEDSLLRGACKRERQYLLSTLEKDKRKMDREKLKAEADAKLRFDKGCNASEEELLSSSYHVYCDATNFEYAVSLFRIDLQCNRNEHYHVKIFESHALPHLYATTAHYTRGGLHIGPHLLPNGVAGNTAPKKTKPKLTEATMILAKHASLFHEAFDAFRAFFKIKTGVAWEDRLTVLELGRAVAGMSTATSTVGTGQSRSVPPAVGTATSHSGGMATPGTSPPGGELKFSMTTQTQMQLQMQVPISMRGQMAMDETMETTKAKGKGGGKAKAKAKGKGKGKGKAGGEHLSEDETSTQDGTGNTKEARDAAKFKYLPPSNGPVGVMMEPPGEGW
ncbi:MAG: hypothetical protein M1838_002723 [Thelocarpon superellum]|nr:MAG: hypothetical protein M1838_002723 [Thelocarpon superellum]